MTEKSTVIRGADTPAQSASWGSMQWLVNGDSVPGTAMTLGRVTFQPGQGNPAHSHPDCDEILFVIAGTIEHTLPEGGVVTLEAGDCIVMSRGRSHSAKNIGDTHAVAIVVFNTPNRRTNVEE